LFERRTNSGNRQCAMGRRKTKTKNKRRPSKIGGDFSKSQRLTCKALGKKSNGTSKKRRDRRKGDCKNGKKRIGRVEVFGEKSLQRNTLSKGNENESKQKKREKC